MLSRIKAFFVREQWLGKGEAATLSRLPPDVRRARLGVVLHDICVKTAARFLEEEHRRADSPFKDLPKSDLFHEMLVMNFWVLEWLFKGKRQQLMDHLYSQYSSSFVWGRESSHEELMNAMRGKFRTYDSSWNDYSGHQDVFAGQALGIIFGDQNVPGAPQAAFWLISYADRTMKDFTHLGKSVDLLLKEKAGQI